MVALVELFKYLGSLLVGDTGSVVGYFSDDTLLASVELYADMSVFIGELDGVIYDILPYLRHKLLIADIGDLFKVDIKLDILS